MKMMIILAEAELGWEQHLLLYYKKKKRKVEDL